MTYFARCILAYFIFMAIVIGGVTCVMATERPPAAFDKPYHGKVVIKYVSQHQFPKRIRRHVKPGYVLFGWEDRLTRLISELDKRPTCILYINRNMSAQKRKQTIRHERGHCNGWLHKHSKLFGGR